MDLINDFNGRIITANGGFYTVEAPFGVCECRARGVFRIKGITPLCGDIARVTQYESEEPLIIDILPRRNSIIRPPLANIDVAVIVVSTCEPKPNPFILDKLISIFEYKGIETALAFTKQDLQPSDEFEEIYREIGFHCFDINPEDGKGSAELYKYLSGKLAILIGNSGVGKSTLINAILPELSQSTQIISKKLGRGKHTTRTVQLFRNGDGYIADTPGFSTVDTARYSDIPSDEVKLCFREFADINGKCRFLDCNHLKEKGCLAEGKISESRYRSYERMFFEAKEAENKYD